MASGVELQSGMHGIIENLSTYDGKQAGLANGVLP